MESWPFVGAAVGFGVGMGIYLLYVARAVVPAEDEFGWAIVAVDDDAPSPVELRVRQRLGTSFGMHSSRAYSRHLRVESSDPAIEVLRVRLQDRYRTAERLLFAGSITCTLLGALLGSWMGGMVVR